MTFSLLTQNGGTGETEGESSLFLLPSQIPGDIFKIGQLDRLGVSLGVLDFTVGVEKRFTNLIQKEMCSFP